MIRICTIRVPRFVHGGLEVGKSWAAIAELDPKQRAALRDFHGRFIRVHPEDRRRLGELGLRFEDEHKPLADERERGGPPAHGSTKPEDKGAAAPPPATSIPGPGIPPASKKKER